MKRGSAGLIKETLRIWQPHYAACLSEEDADGIATNMVDFFGLLAEWVDDESGTARRPSPEGGDNGHQEA